MNKIFGIGISKTGTTSLNTALNLLNIESRNFPMDRTKEQKLFIPRTFEDWNSQEAWCNVPCVWHLEELDNAFPNSKFIYTIRNKQDWLDSCRKFWIKKDNFKLDSMIRMMHRSTFTVNEYNEDIFSQRYDYWTDYVMNYFEDRVDLLLLNICEGNPWVELCNFLEYDVPTIPFPHKNKNETVAFFPSFQLV